jgi:hypothetical protein
MKKQWSRGQVHKAGGGSYQTLINDALRRFAESAESDLEDTLGHELSGVQEVWHLLARAHPLLLEEVAVEPGRLDRRGAVEEAVDRLPVGAERGGAVRLEERQELIRPVVLLEGETPCPRRRRSFRPGPSWRAGLPGPTSAAYRGRCSEAARRDTTLRIP